MAIRKMSAENFNALRKLYTVRLHELRQQTVLVFWSARIGSKEPEEAIQEMDEIDQEVKGIIECGRMMVNLRRG